MPHKRLLPIILFAVLLIGVAPAVAQSQIAITLPDISGNFAVSRVDYDLTDSSRDEIFTDDPNDKREIMLTVYYPADPAPDAEVAPYMSDSLRQAVTQQLGIPAMMLDITTHVYQDQPVASGDFPLLIFSPGFGNLTAYYTSLLEEVASHGYIIAAMWHPYSTGLVEFADGRIAALNDAGSDLANNNDGVFGVWTGDALFALDTLEQFNQDDSLLTGHINFEHVGAFGHSFGGATAAEIAHDDARVDAAINMDGTMFGEVADEGLTKPFMMMESELTPPTDAQLEAAGVTRAEIDQSIQDYKDRVQTVVGTAQPGYRFHLIDSEHNSYSTDMLSIAEKFGALIGPSVVGTIEPQHAFDLISTYVIAFFDQQLGDDGSTELDDLPGDANVTFETFNGA